MTKKDIPSVNTVGDVTIIHAYTSNKKLKIYETKANNWKNKRSKLTTISEDFNIPSSMTDTSSGQKTNKDIEDLNNAINQVVLIYIYQTSSNNKLGSSTQPV